MAKKKQVKTGLIITYVVVALLLIAVVGLVAFFTNGFTSEFATFFLKVNGDFVTGDAVNYCTSTINPLNVETLYTFEPAETEENRGYIIDIKVNENISFNFAVDGEMHSSRDDIDWTLAFDITETDKGFTLTPKSNYLGDILALVCGGENAEYSIPDNVPNMFCLHVYSYDESACINVYFSVSAEIYSVSLDVTEVVL